MIDLPEWLIEVRNDKYSLSRLNYIFSRQTENAASAKFIKLLNASDELETMWKSLKRRNKNGLWFNQFYTDIDLSLKREKPEELPDEEIRLSRQDLTDAKAKEIGLKISKKAKDIAKLLNDYDFDTYIFGAMDNTTTNSFANSLIKNGQISPFGDSSLEFLECMLPCLPLSDYLEQVAEYAVNNSNRYFAAKGKITPSSYFIIELTQRMIEHYNQPLRQVVATAASVIFNREFTVGHVSTIAPASKISPKSKSNP